jgi:hypothetical protein
LVSTFSEFGGEIHYLRRLVDRDDKRWSAFNPSIAYSPTRGYAIAFRSSNYVILPHGELHVGHGGPIKNQVWFSELGEDLELLNLRQIDFSDLSYEMKRGVEDPKLMWRDGGWVFTAVAMERNIPVARQCECYLNDDATAVTRIHLHEGVEAKRPEKNWMTAGNKPENFDFVYDGNGIIKDGMLIKRLQDSKELSALRGNTMLHELGDGTYLALMHRLYVTKKMVLVQTEFGMREAVRKNYHHFFVRIDENGWVVEISEPFQFISEGIEFAAGIVEKDDNYVISLGKDDAYSHLGYIHKSKVIKLLKKI